MVALFYHVFRDRSDRHVEPIVKVSIDRKVVISLRVFSNRFNLEKLLKHFSQSNIVESIDAFAGFRIVALCYIAEHDASLLSRRINRHLVALTDGDSPVGTINPFLEDVRFGLRRDSYCKSRNIFVAVETLSRDRRLDF